MASVLRETILIRPSTPRINTVFIFELIYVRICRYSPHHYRTRWPSGRSESSEQDLLKDERTARLPATAPPGPAEEELGSPRDRGRDLGQGRDRVEACAWVRASTGAGPELQGVPCPMPLPMVLKVCPWELKVCSCVCVSYIVYAPGAAGYALGDSGCVLVLKGAL